MVVQEGIMEQPNIVGRWSEALKALHGRLAHRFARSEARERIRRYLLGQLGRVERKNGRQLAEAIGEADPQGVHRLLNSAKWDATLVRDDLREYVMEHLGDEESGVLIREHHRTCPRVRGGGGADGTPQAPAALLGASQSLAYYRGRTGNRLSAEEVLNVMDPTGREACEISLRRSSPNTYSIHRSLIQHSSSSVFLFLGKSIRLTTGQVG